MYKDFEELRKELEKDNAPPMLGWLNVVNVFVLNCNVNSVNYH